MSVLVSCADCAKCKDAARRLAELERQVAALVAFIGAMPDGPVIR